MVNVTTPIADSFVFSGWTVSNEIWLSAKQAGGLHRKGLILCQGIRTLSLTFILFTIILMAIYENNGCLPNSNLLFGK